MLLDILNAPSIPYDFGETRDGYCLRNLMVLFIDVGGSPSVTTRVLDVTREILTSIDDGDISLPPRDIADPAVLEEIDIPALNRLLRLYSRLQSHLAILQSIYMQTQNIQGRPATAYTTPFNQAQNVDMLGVIGDVVRYVVYLITC